MSSNHLTFFFGALCLAGVTAWGQGAVYTFDSTVEGWTTVGTDGGVDNFRAESGALQFDYVTPGNVFDPIITSPGGLGIDAATHHWLRIDVELTAQGGAGPQTFQVFYDDGDGDGNAGFNEPDSRTFTVTPNAGTATIIFDMAPVQPSRDAYSGTISTFRIDPGTSETDLVGGSAVIDVIALTSDADFDGISDDAEIDIFGDINTADDSSDFDGDGRPDALEILLNLDPLIDEGVTLPVGGAAAVAVMLGVGGVLYIRRRKS